MPTTSAAGARLELAYAALLARRGYTVCITMRSRWGNTITMFPPGGRPRIQSRDFFGGAVDLIAKREHQPTLWVQVTTDTHYVLDRRTKKWRRVEGHVSQHVERLRNLPDGTADEVQIAAWRPGSPAGAQREAALPLWHIYGRFGERIGEVEP